LAYSETFLADLKSRVPISEVIGRSTKLRRNGKEFRSIDNKSLTINDQKGIWFDHATNEGGDVLEWLQKSEGISFIDAVAAVASIAGVPLPNGTGGQTRQNQPKKQQPELSSKREISATYDYTDAQGELIYQVVRLEWIEEGKRQKTFRQRRPDLEKPGEWIWNLEGISHGLYRLPDLRESGIDETVFLPEGEKDVETLIAFGLTATTNSGGAKNWQNDHAEMLRGRNVVVLVDNDDPGRERGNIIVASLQGIAACVRILDFSHQDIWPSAPKGADITDWVKAREGTPEELIEIAERLPEAKPVPFVSTMDLLMWADRNRPGRRRYEYAIDDLIPERQIVVVMGDTGTGKSFFTTAMAMALCRRVPFFGRRIARQLGVIWCAYEAAEGADARMRAYAGYHGLKDEDLPFGALQHPLPLWPNEPNGDLLIKEIHGIVRTKFNGIPLGAIVVDTYNAATPGASEIDSEVVSRIRSYFHRAVQETGATLIIVGHTNSAGKHRGNEQLTNNVDTILKVSFKTRVVDREVIQLKDDDGREIRTMKVVKQREGRSGAEFDFVLHEVADGTKNQYGNSRTSCVVVPFGGSSAGSTAPVKGPRLTHERAVILQCLRTAIEDHGEPVPPMLRLPRSIVRVVNAQHWKRVYLEKSPDAGATDNTINKRLRDASSQFQNLKLIGRTNPFVWIVPGKASADVLDNLFSLEDTGEDFR
jgi:hypothetical protein